MSDLSGHFLHLTPEQADWHICDLRLLVASLCSVMTREQRDSGLDKYRVQRTPPPPGSTRDGR